MAYGSIKVDNIIFTNGGADETTTVSGIYKAITSGVTVSGTISGTTIQGQTISGVTVTGTTIQGASGTFTSLTGVTTTGTTANFVTHNGASGVFTTLLSGATVTGTTAQFTNITGGGIGATTITGTTVTGTTANFVSGVFTTQISGATVTGTTANFTSGNFTTLSGASTTVTSGVFAIGSAAAPSLSFTSDPNTGIYSPGADQVAISTNGTGRVFVDSAGNVGVGTSSPQQELHINDATGVSRIRLTGGAAGTDNFEIGQAIPGVSNSGFSIYDVDATASRLVIDSSGNIGIGGTNSGTIVAINDPGTGLGFYNAANGNFNLGLLGGVASAEAYVYQRANATLIFGTNNTERLRITSAGLLGLGTSSPSSLLEIKSTTTNTGRLRVTGTGTTAGNFRGYEFGNGSIFKGGLLQDESTDLISIFTPVGGQSVNITSAGLVGIGTSSPSALGKALNIYGGAAEGSSIALEANNGSEFCTIFSGATASDPTSLFSKSGFKFAIATAKDATGFSEKMRLDSSGRLGIGTTSPGAKFEILNGHIRLSANYRIGTGGTGDTPDQETIRFSSGSLDFLVGNTERARIDSSGRLLVGTSSTSDSTTAVLQGRPGDASGGGKLTIQGNYNGDAGATYGEIEIKSAGGIVARISGEGDLNHASGDTPGRLVFSTTADGSASPTERMRISSDGLVSCSHSTANQVVINAENTNASFASTVIRPITSRAAGTSCLFFYAVANSVNTFLVYNNGNVQNTNNSYAGISDFKLKENIVDATSQWSDIKALQVRKYNFKEETGQQTHTQIGLIAQEVELVSPGLVSESPDRNAEGNDLGTVTKSVNYSVLYMKAVKALQEAMERIEALEADVDQLKGA